MSASEFMHQIDPTMTPPWTRPAPLPDVPGGETNLLPRNAWADPGNPLRVEFKPWYDTPPSDDGTERVDVFLDDNETNIIGTRTWPLPMDPADYFIEIAAGKLPQGEHQISFIMENFQGVSARSHPFTVTIDKQAPLLNASSELIFPAEVRPPNSIDIDYLARPENNDQVIATVPAYTTAAPGDVVIATWKNPANSASQELRSQPLTHLNYNDPVKLTFTGEFIRAMGDGPRVVFYRVEDRASNPSAESTPVDLDVAAIRPPRFAPNPWVLEIEDDPSDWGPLDPLNALNGVTVRIPDKAVYFRDDRVEVQFGEPGTAGEITVPVPWGTKEVKIPPENVAAYFKKSMLVNYIIYPPEGSNKPSDFLEVAVREFPPARFSPPQLVSPHSDPVFKSAISDSGLPAHQRTWNFISTRSLITITVSGRDQGNVTRSRTVLNKEPVTLAQMTGGVPATLPKDFMMSLKSDERFKVLTQVSFDDGESWFPFPELTPMLRS